VLHNYPSIGLTFYYSGFGNDSISAELGKVFALYPFINFPITPGESSRLTFKLGVGVSYLTNKFDPKENYHNYAIGSHVNASINLSFEYRQRIVDRLHWVTSAGLTHFSNGATRSPNMGINILSAATGLSWYLAPPKKHIDKKFAGYIRIGASPRATINFLKIAKASALMNGRTYAVPEDVKNMRHQVLRHRIGLNYAAVADNVSVETLINMLVNSVPTP
jgi:hypothetical protein